MKKKHLFIGLIIAALACYYTFRNISLKELSAALASIHYIYLIPALFIYLLFFYVRCLRWKYLIKSIKDVPTNRLISPMYIGFMGNMLPARMGELIRSFLLSKKEDIPFSSSFATVVIERIFDMASILVILGSLFFFKSDLMGSGVSVGGNDIIEKMIIFGWVSLAGIVVFVLFSLLLVFKQNIVVSWVKFFSNPFSEKIQSKILDVLNSFTEGLHVLKDLKTTLIVIFLSAIIWMLSLSMYYPFFLAFDLGYLPFSAIIIVFVLVCIFIALFPTPGYVGSFQAACMVGLHTLFNVPEATAASFGIVVWAFSMIIVVIGGLYYIFKDNISIKEITTKACQ